MNGRGSYHVGIMRKLTLVVAALALPLLAQIPLPPAPERYVTDRANVLDDTRELALNERLAEYQRTTSNQIIVYVDRRVPQGTTLEEMGAEAIRTWKVGQTKKDNGAILFLFIDDRQSRIEAGYGLEGVLTKARSKRILVEMRQPLRAGDYTGAAELGAEQIINTISPTAPAPAPVSEAFSLYVIDDEHVLDDVRARILNARLAEYERETAIRFFVRVELRAPEGTTPDQIAAQAIAKGDVETGAILLLFVEEGEARIAVSDSLRDRLPESRVNSILQNLGEPLHSRSYTTVAERAVDSMTFAIAQPYAVPPPPAPVHHGIAAPESATPSLIETVPSMMIPLI